MTTRWTCECGSKGEIAHRQDTKPEAVRRAVLAQHFVKTGQQAEWHAITTERSYD